MINAVFEFCRLISWAVGAIAAAWVLINVFEWLGRVKDRRQ